MNKSDLVYTMPNGAPLRACAIPYVFPLAELVEGLACPLARVRNSLCDDEVR